MLIARMAACIFVRWAILAFVNAFSKLQSLLSCIKMISKTLECIFMSWVPACFCQGSPLSPLSIAKNILIRWAGCVQHCLCQGHPCCQLHLTVTVRNWREGGSIVVLGWPWDPKKSPQVRNGFWPSKVIIINETNDTSKWLLSTNERHIT